MRFVVLVLGMGLVTACRSSAPPSAAPPDAGASSAATPTCTNPIVVRAQIYGAFEGKSGSGLKGPFMVVGMEHAPSFGMAGPSFGTVADLELEAPRFAAEYAPSDLCSDEGSTPERIAINCITGPSAKITKLVVTREGSGLLATRDGTQKRWQPPEWEASRCFELHGLDEKRDLEPLRKTWMVDEPKCARNPSSAPVKIALRLDPLAAPGGRYDAKVTLVGADPPRALGTMTNMSGAVGFRHLSEVNGINFEASDEGLDRRFAYQLGDRAYYVAPDGRVHAAELPCGARAAFEIRSSGKFQILEHPP